MICSYVEKQRMKGSTYYLTWQWLYDVSNESTKLVMFYEELTYKSKCYVALYHL